jgi:tRNA (cmo5U34)-methyltransferase
MSKKDSLFAKTLENPQPFSFNQSVAEVFDDMIQRSVPGYRGLIEQIASLSELVVTDGSRVYDLGASLGAVTLAIRRQLDGRNTSIIAVDNSAAMVERCQLLVNAYQADLPVEVIHSNIQDIDIHNASLVVMNYTLQFIPIEQRDALIQRIYEGLLPGGVLVLSEKIELATEATDTLVIKLHEQFKRQQGYSELEISQKRDALQNILIPETYRDHEHRLNQAGFNDVSLWYQHYNFCSILAIK